MLRSSELRSSRVLGRHRGDACRMAAGWLPALAGGEGQVSRRVRVHVQTCLRCQAELARYRRLLRTLDGLRSQHVAPAPDSLAGVLAAIEASGVERSARALASGRRVAYVGGVAATAAAGAAGAVVWATRRRADLFG